MGWEAFLAEGERISDEALDQRMAGIGTDDVATLIYTSGTTGTPKGVVLSHANLVDTSRLALGLLPVGPGDSNLSYLPLSHVAEQMFTVYMPTVAGSTVYYAEAPERVLDNLREVQPTLIFGVPRVWEKMSAAVASRLAAGRGLERRVANWASSVGRRVTALRNTGGSPSGLLELQRRIANRVFHSKVKRLLGLGRARFCVTGAAPIARSVLDFFAGLDLTLYEVYGQSEGCGPTTWNPPGNTRLGTVGPPLPGVEVRLAEDGEILVRGPNVFQGYFRDAEATAETLTDGWLHTGDLGVFDEEGFLTITGRKKEILITSGGKNIAPRVIEDAVQDLDLVGEVMAVGDGRPFVTVLITLDEEEATRFAEGLGIEPGAVASAPALRTRLAADLERVNRNLARVEQVRDFRVLDRPFSIEAGELTPTLKLKRTVIEARHAALVEEMYAV
jgi:long-chain acyl-CoA synthetase